jgi:cytoskeletal protein CcmA (bactofilin family)
MFSRTTPDGEGNTPTPAAATPATSPTSPPPPRQGSPSSASDTRDPFKPASQMTASTIGTDLTILGEKITIVSQYQLHIDGDVRADINGRQVTIGQEGSVIGTITADKVEIHGGLNGAVKAKSVSLESTAKVEGDIHHETLAIAEGAEFDGRVRRPKTADELTPNLDPSTLPGGRSVTNGSGPDNS